MKNSGEYIISLGFIVFGFVLLFLLFDAPDRNNSDNRPRSNQKSQTSTVSAKANPEIPNFTSKGIQLSEAHWQGMEVIPLTQELKTKLKIPRATTGVLVDEVTLNAAKSGMEAGDILVAINRQTVKEIEDVVELTKKIREERQAGMSVLRKGTRRNYVIKSGDVLGFAQTETAPMILASDPRPHPYRGPCTKCHPIGTGGQMVPDPDNIPLPVPPIAKDAKRPHRDRGSCEACHIVY